MIGKKRHNNDAFKQAAIQLDAANGTTTCPDFKQTVISPRNFDVQVPCATVGNASSLAANYKWYATCTPTICNGKESYDRITLQI